MFRIRKVMDDVLPINRVAIAQAQEILRSQFHLLSGKDVDKLPDQIRDPMKHRFKAMLFVADVLGHKKESTSVRGFALLLHAPDLRFCYLDYISIEPGAGGRGYGGALYERVREEAKMLGALGVFFECLPDDPKLCPDKAVLAQNARRLRFYEKYDARPIINTAYETPLTPGDTNPPYLVYDGLGAEKPLGADDARKVARAILERKYKNICPPKYIDMVVDSFKDDPVQLRPPKYRKKDIAAGVTLKVRPIERIALVVNDKHDIHHVKERGYVESPVRINSILDGLSGLDVFQVYEPTHFAERHITDVHDQRYFSYFKRACANLPEGESVYPYVFPIRNSKRPPKELTMRAGYYCIDTFTPLNRNAFIAARRAVDCTLTCAQKILEGHRLAYALVRPPGHHAEVSVFGGFCYFNSAAIAAHYLSMFERLAVLDVDYHHGNGTQDIFYSRADVLTISLHGHPNVAYPYFSGFEEETGAGPGTGFNINIPLPEDMDGGRYMRHLEYALRRIKSFKARFLVLSLGLDTAKGDPTGSWMLGAADFQEMGLRIGRLHIPVLVVQEGGYDTSTIGINARSFFEGLWKGVYG